ncbi:MAG: hypothetical protein U0793_16165 [Gemmataceae bacterium]
MKTSNVISREAQEHFWRVVRECLRKFHHATSSVLERLHELRAAIDASPIEEIELFFHNEPFDVACNVARHPLPMEPVLDQYLAIRDGAA